MAAAQIAMNWSPHGPCLTLSTACASSDAIGMDARRLPPARWTLPSSATRKAGLA
ncbi:beta-ketoacyl synthase N-terminal-like domain-containing protein [Nocardia sp. NPDC050408]|uniref:beta-ketoacyl synthase N-terminal-like domain-containing protein n=1 Tax=Nocardia sp. NPDC050408 TaxID=3364319 RepID=UPI0037A7AFA4